MASGLTSYDRTEKLARTTKEVISSMVHREPSDWNFAAPRVLMVVEVEKWL